MSARKICVVTGSRAEYGLLKGVIRAIADHPVLELRLVVTGAHLSPDFGLSYREIQADGFRIDHKVELPLGSDAPAAIARATGVAMTGFADVLGALKPDIVLLLGDRYEILAAATACLLSGIPIAHIHGGEVTEGAIDDAMRHAMTKMAALHFVAAEPYRDRVIRMGEAPDHVFMVGGLGVDAIKAAKLASRADIEKELRFTFGPRNLLVTFHPATAEKQDAGRQCDELLAALDANPEPRLLFTLANADAGGRAVNARIQDFVTNHPGRAAAFASLGSRLYLSCLDQVDGVVGNSSSGLLEAPSFHIGTVNIGDRQKGRLKAASIIDCPPERAAIGAAVTRLYDPAFRQGLNSVENPYGDGGATARIVKVLEAFPLPNLRKKAFYDPPVAAAS